MKTKLIIASAILFAASATSAFADGQKCANSAINVNEIWYNCFVDFNWTTGGFFNGANLGKLDVLKLGGQTQVWDGNSNWNSGTAEMHWRIDKDENNSGIINLTYYGYEYYQDSRETWMKFQSGGSNFTTTEINISNLADGQHTLEVWFYRGAWDSNGGQNYVATFSKGTIPISKSSDISVSDKTVDVKINGLTLYKDDHWNTICLPFNVNVQTSVLEGAEIRELNSASVSGSTLTLNFSNSLSSASIEAGKPYIIKWSNGTNIVDPVFTNIVLSTSQAGEVPGTGVTFKGTFDQIDCNSTDNYLLVGDNDKLCYPADNARILPFRAYFDLGTNASPVKAINLNFGDDTNSIQTISNETNSKDGYYTIDGRRLNDKPATAGLYIHNGKKVVIK